MIFEGERNCEEKIKLLSELIANGIEMDIMQSKRNKILYLCSECGLQISFEPKAIFSGKPYMTFNYDNYKDWFEKDPDYIQYSTNYKNTKIGNWSGSTSHICLDCGKGLFKDELSNSNCKHENLVEGNELNGKPCPICGTGLNEGINIQGLKEYFSKERELKDIWWNIYRERYRVKKTIPNIYSEEEIVEQERQSKLIKCYKCDYFVLDNSHNVIRFEFRDSFMSGTFSCVLEWEKEKDGKITLFKEFRGVWVEKVINKESINEINYLLNKYNFFNKSFFIENDSIGLDGYTFGVEAKIDNNYKELAIWGIERGILYDVGMLLIQFAGKTFRELYKYAW